MTKSAKENILSSLLFQNIAYQYLEFTKHELKGVEKNFLNQLINRLSANKNDCYSKITSNEGREIFLREITKGDALQYANIFLMMLECDEDKKNSIEKLVNAIHKGEIVEFVNK